MVWIGSDECCAAAVYGIRIEDAVEFRHIYIWSAIDDKHSSSLSDTLYSDSRCRVRFRDRQGHIHLLDLRSLAMPIAAKINPIMTER
jgi:hypothetical protein